MQSSARLWVARSWGLPAARARCSSQRASPSRVRRRHAGGAAPCDRGRRSSSNLRSKDVRSSNRLWWLLKMPPSPRIQRSSECGCAPPISHTHLLPALLRSFLCMCLSVCCIFLCLLVFVCMQHKVTFFGVAFLVLIILSFVIVSRRFSNLCKTKPGVSHWRCHRMPRSTQPVQISLRTERRLTHTRNKYRNQCTGNVYRHPVQMFRIHTHKRKLVVRHRGQAHISSRRNRPTFSIKRQTISGE